MRTDANSTPATKPGRCRTALALLLALLWVQLGVAAHQFDHVAGDLGDYCEICIKLDRAGHAVPPAAPAAGPSPTAQIAPVVEDVAAATTHSAHYRSRAPPFV